MRAPAVVTPPTEHISLESAVEEPPRIRRGSRRVRAALDWRNSLRGIRTHIEILEDHFVHVRYLQPRKRARDYSVDLRFVNAKPVRERHIAWMLLTAAIALLAAAGALLSRFGALPLTSTQQVAISILAATTGMSLIALFLHRTTESLTFTTVHGGATILRITGGLGSGRNAKAFFVELIKSINLAHAHAPPMPGYLRDEMREHHRLLSCKALSDAEYEVSKERILAAHGS